MANNSTLITGKAFWTKILGKPVPKYEQPADAPLKDREWTFDLSVDNATVKVLKDLGLGSKIKNKQDDMGNYITFKRNATKNDEANTPNNPIKVVDHHGKPWDSKVSIGNGSTLNVRFNVYQGRKANKPVVLAVQVWDLVKYNNPNGDFPVKEEDFSTAVGGDFSAVDDSEVA
jgi:hypothetical protein